MTIADLSLLKQGKPPQSKEMIDYLTVMNPWLENMRDYCLNEVILNGGCKVKILYGDKYTGKTHYLQFLKNTALKEGFFVVMLDIAKMDFQLTKIASLYRHIAEKFNFDKLKDSLLEIMLKNLGYEKERFMLYSGRLCDFISELESAPAYVAKQSIRKCINKVVQDMDISFSFRLFLRKTMEAISEGDDFMLEILKKWFLGEKLERFEKRQCQLFEALQNKNARIWLYSFSEIIKMTDFKGLVLIFDHFESILPQFDCNVKYTPAKRNDVYEMLRQLIDDFDFLSNFLFIIAGNSAIIDNEKHGLESYHALWMRIQQCYKQDEMVNPYADLINTDLIMKQLFEQGKMQVLSEKIKSILKSGKFQMLDGEEKENIVLTDFRMTILKETQNYAPEG